MPDDSLAGKIDERIKAHSDATGNFMRDYAEFDELYRCIPGKKKSKAQRANTFIAEIFRCIETDVTGIEEIQFRDDPWFYALPLNLTGDQIEKAENTQALLEKQAHGSVFSPSLRSKLKPALRSFLLNGTAIGRVMWSEKTRMVADGANFRERTLYSGPDFVHVPLWQFHFDPSATDIDNARWVAERRRIHAKQIVSMCESAKSLPGAWVMDIEDVKILCSSDSKGPTTEGSSTQNKMRQSRGYEDKPDKNPMWTDYWGENPEEETDYFWRIWTVNGETIMKVPNPYNHGLLPFVKASLIELDDSFLGLGFGTMLKYGQLEINDFQNLSLDAIALAVYNCFTQDGGSLGQETSTLKLRPGAVFSSGDHPNLKPLITNLSGIAPAMSMVRTRISDMQGITAATAIQQSIPTDVSAREVSSMGNASDARLRGMTQVWVDRMCRKTLWMWHEMNKQLKVESDTVSITAPDGMVSERPVFGRRKSFSMMNAVNGLLGRTPKYESDIVDDVDMKMSVTPDIENRNDKLRRISAWMKEAATLGQVFPQVGLDVIPMVRQVFRESSRLLGIRPLAMMPMQPVPGTPSPLAGEAPPFEEGAGVVPPLQNPSNGVGIQDSLPPVPPTLPPGQSQAGGVMPQ